MVVCLNFVKTPPALCSRCQTRMKPISLFSYLAQWNIYKNFYIITLKKYCAFKHIFMYKFSSPVDICLCKFSRWRWVRKNRKLDLSYVMRPHKRQFLIYFFNLFLFFYLQVAVCITCVILQAKSEENPEARELDEEFEGMHELPGYVTTLFIVDLHAIYWSFFSSLWQWIYMLVTYSPPH